MQVVTVNAGDFSVLAPIVKGWAPPEYISIQIPGSPNQYANYRLEGVADSPTDIAGQDNRSGYSSR